MELTEEQISFMRGEIPASGPQVWMTLLEGGLIRIERPPSVASLPLVTGWKDYGEDHLFCLTPKGAEAIRSQMVSAEITGITP